MTGFATPEFSKGVNIFSRVENRQRSGWVPEGIIHDHWFAFAGVEREGIFIRNNWCSDFCRAVCKLLMTFTHRVWCSPTVQFTGLVALSWVFSLLRTPHGVAFIAHTSLCTFLSRPSGPGLRHPWGLRFVAHITLNVCDFKGFTESNEPKFLHSILRDQNNLSNCPL